jgi:hypothetical protein
MNALVRAIVTKIGRRSIVLLDEARAWVTKLPKLTPTSTPSEARGLA